MNMQQTQQKQLTDKELAQDALCTEKFLAAQYNAFLAECATPDMIGCLGDLLCETHRMQQGLFREMNSRGWYPVTTAEEQKIAQAKQKFSAGVAN
jgi:spore coat protein CotF